MSLDAYRWAWQQNLKPTRKLVLLSLADRADENNICYPSVPRLESDTGLYRETIHEAIRDMESGGILDVIRSRGVANKYRLIGVPKREEERHPEVVGKSRLVGERRPVGKSRPDQSGKAAESSREKPPLIYHRTDQEPLEGKKPKRRNTPVPDTFAITDKLSAWAAQRVNGMDLTMETDKFIDYHRAKGSLFKDWDAAWRNWIRNAIKFNGGNRETQSWT